MKLTRFWFVGIALILGACSGAILPGEQVPLPTGQTLPVSAAVSPSPPSTTVAPSLVPPTSQSPRPPSVTWTPTLTASATPFPPVRFAVIGDYGGGGPPEADVAELVNGWGVDFIITVGDNNYPDGAAETIDHNIGRFYHAYISPYVGKYGNGADQNRFFPTLGNHDWNSNAAQPYLDYFTLPGNERYYDFTWEPIHFFALDSDSREPDGVGKSSVQADWLREALQRSTAVWKVVYLHHAPYSSGLHGPTGWAQWPYAAWGADVVLAGHDHTYERLLIDGIPYFVNGLGGGSIYRFVDIHPGSQVRYNDDYGAMLVEADAHQMIFQFFNRRGELIDAWTLYK